MSEDTQFKKEIQDRKKGYQEKKVELISRLCAEEESDKKDNKKLKVTEQ